MKNTNIKNILSIGMLSTLGLLPIQKASAQKPSYENPDFTEKQTTNDHCKFIEGGKKLVVNYKDTFWVYDVYTTFESGKKQVVCNLGPSMQRFVCNLDYYMNTPWFPSFNQTNSAEKAAITRDLELVSKYYEFQNQGDYIKRDSVELLLLKNREKFKEMLKQKQK